MDVEIGQLREYPKLYELAVGYATQDRVSPEDIDTTTVGNMIYWEDTDEGGDFWCEVNNGNFAIAMTIFPELFERPTNHILTINNGLCK